MINYKKIITAERVSWSEELARYRLFLTRAELTEDQAKKLDFFESCIIAILRELDELEELAKDQEQEKKYKIVKLYTSCYKNKNGEDRIGFYTFWPVFVAGEENLGPQVKSIKIVFDKVVDLSPFKNGDTLLVEKSKMHVPLYKIDNGKYPYIWIDEVEDIMHEEEQGVIK